MKQYGLEKTVKGRKWKRDFHIHINFKKIGNWWEEICKPTPRSTMKQQLRKRLTQ
jgi:hypothetical protein